MFVHVVQAGESLFSVSHAYQISIEQLSRVNGFDGTNIVPGQALLIPRYTYIVQPGDSLYRISRKAYVTVQQLRNANPGINETDLTPGRSIRIPYTSNYLAGTLEFYVVRSPEEDVQLINQFAPYSSSISIFEYHFASNGEIVNDLNDLTAIETTWRNHVTPIATITNISSQGFDPDLTHQVLNNPTTRRNLINNIYFLVSRKGYGGVNIDFERVRAEDRDIFTGFLRELRDRLRQGRFVITISVPAKTSDDVPWLRGYDYGGIGAVVDFMFIMAYDWHYGGSEPGPVAPITEIRRTIEFSLTRVPERKIIIGVPLYGYDWIVPHRPGTIARGISNQEAILRAMRYQSPVQYSEEYQSPFFRYTDSQGVNHEVWFEDVRSMSTKMVLVREYNLQAIGAWQLSLGFTPGVWLLRKFFTIRKI
ncbi:glycoside hydrolase family 18 protein [Neobacillus terrae]|uniref:glycoside hydrolase family 18 protein n=1 Tax=Neobacillus terrae TaxID=3034837 RepID=UPI00140C3AE9|nr:glycoside hydrolase family 18 protein [Neobacillus terrae]NHM33722.1 LysM peptidoglycan-binding domain-containing protein [Neobacillus terrae]